MNLQEIKNEIIGELICREKYKYLPKGCVGEIARDVFEELEKKEAQKK